MDVLYVEDIQAISKNISTKLSRYGYNVVCTRGCKDTIHLLQSYRPRIILLDVKLCDGNGLDLLRVIYKVYNPYVIVCTGNTQDSVVLECLRLGANDFVAKPINLERLLIALKKAEVVMSSWR
ncbi:MAG: response regulator [Candidatus Anstonellales archaeon]